MAIMSNQPIERSEGDETPWHGHTFADEGGVDSAGWRSLVAQGGAGGSSLRILAVGGDSLARAGITTLLTETSAGNVVGQATGSGSLADDLDVYQPDVVIWDFGWDPELAVASLSELPEDAPPVIVLLPNEDHAAQARAAGATGLLLREVDSATLAAAISAVGQGMVVLAPALASAALVGASRPSSSGGVGATPRELEVLQLLAEGLPNKAIADRMAISEHTVKFHINALMGKLGAQSRTEAVVIATRAGLLRL